MTPEESKCKRKGYLHDYVFFRHDPLGILEVCSKCGKVLFTHHKTPNNIYLNHHYRVALRPSHPRFNIEYA